MSLPASNRFTAWGDPASGRRIIVGIGELAVVDRPDDVIVTYALGSCIAVCLFDAVAGVAAMLHFLLPDSSINAQRAIAQPGTFGDTGIPLLVEKAAQRGLKKSRTTVRLVGGAMVATNPGGSPPTGHRNLLAARSILWRLGLFIGGQDVGGGEARTVHFAARDGRLLIVSGQKTKEI
jgi:chemotaxis protein CheD